MGLLQSQRLYAGACAIVPLSPADTGPPRTDALSYPHTHRQNYNTWSTEGGFPGTIYTQTGIQSSLARTGWTNTSHLKVCPSPSPAAYSSLLLSPASL